MDAYIRAVAFLSRVAGVFAAFLIGFAVLVICDMVIERYFFNLHDDLADRRRDLLHRRGDLRRQRLCADDARPRQRRRSAALSQARAALLAGAGDELLALAFVLVLFVLCTALLVQAWASNWHSDTVWRARLWIPYLAMPVGLGLLVLQYFVELICLLTGRAPPFGIPEKAGAETRRTNRRAKRWEAPDEPDRRRARSSSSSRC